jgi:hypothetical protein
VGVVDRGDDVTLLDTGLVGRAPRHDAEDDRALFDLHAELTRHVGGELRDLHAGERMHRLPVAEQLRDDLLDCRHRGREPDLHRTGRRRQVRLVDTDHLTVPVEQATSGVAW